MEGEGETLGQKLMETFDCLGELIRTTHNQDRLNELKKLRKKLLTVIGSLVEANLRKASQEYKAAMEGLDNASQKIEEALKGMESVAETIKAIGEALDLVARLVPK